MSRNKVKFKVSDTYIKSLMIMPDEAKIIDVAWEKPPGQAGYFIFCVEHPDFNEVEEDSIPLIEPILRTEFNYNNPEVLTKFEWGDIPNRKDEKQP